MLNLSDVQAPYWVWKASAEKRYRMRPLSLATFAEAELMGCGLDHLLSKNEQESLEAWINLYAFLSETTPEEASLEIVSNPKMFEAFAMQVQQTFLPPHDDDPSNKTSHGKSHRKSKDPREKIKIPDGDSMKPDGSPGSTDYTVLFDLARLTKISLTDIYKMTFRGLIGLTKHLEDNPPIPSGLLGEGV